MFYLEEHMKNARSLFSISGVYWSARDIDFFLVGNHHFITFIFESSTQANRVTIFALFHLWKVKSSQRLG
jgi:hypothetical protein